MKRFSINFFSAPGAIYIKVFLFTIMQCFQSITLNKQEEATTSALYPSAISLYFFQEPFYICAMQCYLHLIKPHNLS